MLPCGPMHLSGIFVDWRLPATCASRDHAGLERRVSPVYKPIPDELL